MFKVKISGLGKYIPEKILTNNDLEKLVDTNDEWITTRTGIKERHIVAENETTAMIGAKAAEKAIEQSGISKDLIELIYSLRLPRINLSRLARVSRRTY